MTRLVRQRSPCQCMIACISMATGHRYGKVLRVGLETEGYVEGYGCRSEQKILRALGLRDEFRAGRPAADCDFISQYRSYDRSAASFRDLAWGRRAIFTVPSLNNEGGHHAVYWDGRRVLDPNPDQRKRYRRWDELLPSQAVLFNEVPA